MRFLLVVALLSCTTLVRAAVCEPYGQLSPVALPSAIAVPIHARAGELLTGFHPAAGSAGWHCDLSGVMDARVLWQDAYPPQRMQVDAPDGMSYTVVPSTVEGIGLLIRARLAMHTGASSDTETVTAGVSGKLLRKLSMLEKVNIFLTDVSVALVKTGASFSFVSELRPGQAGRFGIQINGQLDPGGYVIRYPGIHLVAPTCQVPDVTVHMPVQSLRDLHGSGMRTGSWQPFRVRLQDCPGVRRIAYRFHTPYSGLLDAEQQVIRPDRQHMAASGVGIQIAEDDGSDTPVRFDRAYRYPDVARATGRNVDVLFRARYVKPAGMLASAGLVRSSVVVELSYE